MKVEPAVRAIAGGVAIAVRVTTRASKTSVGPVKDGRLLVRVTAAPVDHAANDALRLAIADALDLPRRAVQIAGGLSSRNKTVQVAGVTPVTVSERLGGGAG